jgi:multidrug efflux pump subunit AcrB
LLFVRRAVSLLTENLVIGTLLALSVVWWFMRECRISGLIAASIPLCLFTEGRCGSGSPGAQVHLRDPRP